MTEQTSAPSSVIEQRFPGVVVADERDGYEGYLVEANKPDRSGHSPAR